MTNDTPLTPVREQEIRTLDLLELVSDRVGAVIGGHLAVLLGEVDRLRTALSDASDQVAERDDEIGNLSARLHHLDRNALPELRREVEHHKDGKARWRGRAEKAEARVAELESATGTARAMHRKHTDSEHCQYDDMTWPCPTVTALDDQASPAARPTGFPMLTGRARHDARVAAERLGIDPSKAAEQAEGRAELDAMRVQHPAPCRVPNSPDCTCPVGSTYQSRILPSRAATCTCGHSGADHHHAGTACWANLPRARHPRTGVVGPVATCACTSFTTTS